MTDRIEEIRARHKAVNELVEYELPSQMHDDREMLLAEVDRQRAEIDRLNRERDEVIEALAEVQQFSDYLAGSDR